MKCLLFASQEIQWQGCLLLVVAIFFAIVIGIFSFFPSGNFLFSDRSGKYPHQPLSQSDHPVVNAQAHRLLSLHRLIQHGRCHTSLTPWTAQAALPFCLG